MDVDRRGSRRTSRRPHAATGCSTTSPTAAPCSCSTTSSSCQVRTPWSPSCWPDAPDWSWWPRRAARSTSRPSTSTPCRPWSSRSPPAWRGGAIRRGAAVRAACPQGAARGSRSPSDNVADVSAVCRRLDGLPLAIELAAARTRLLTPKALLARLDDLLELSDTGVDRPTRQQTLRTPSPGPTTCSRLRCSSRSVGWGCSPGAPTSTPSRRSSSRRTPAPMPTGPDTLQVVSDLVEASLVTVSESFDDEPRIGMLETVRSLRRRAAAGPR